MGKNFLFYPFYSFELLFRVACGEKLFRILSSFNINFHVIGH